MRNNTCTICGSEFEPREGKLYCSNACKQKAFSDKKQGNALKEQKEQEQQAVKEKLAFYFTDFQEYGKKYPKNMESFLLFCFFRKNFSGKFDAEQFHAYINTFDSYWWDEFWGYDCGERTDKITPARKRYMEFEAKFFGDDVVVSFTKQEKPADGYLN